MPTQQQRDDVDAWSDLRTEQDAAVPASGDAEAVSGRAGLLVAEELASAVVSHSSDAQGDPSSVHSHWADGKRSQELPAATRQKMEGAFGQSFGGVKVHPASDRAAGSVHALAQGEELHFAPGRFRPGTAEGDWLIAHELAHVVQQRGQGAVPAAAGAQKFSPDGHRGLLEHDADEAAHRAVDGDRAELQMSAAPGMEQRFESWEHRSLGIRGGGGQMVSTRSGVILTYGELVAMAGDFYDSPEAVLNAPAEELNRLLHIIRYEAAQADRSPTGCPTDQQLDQNTKAYQDATIWRERAHYDARGHKTGKTEGQAAGTESRAYLTLAGNNSSHFTPHNVAQSWLPNHRKALQLAEEHHAEQKRSLSKQPRTERPRQPAPQPHSQAQAAPGHSATPGEPSAPATGDEDKFNLALVQDGFACHFLTDSFASGHLMSGRVGRKVGQTFWAGHESQIVGALQAAANQDLPSTPHHVVNAAVNQLVGLPDFRANVGSLCLKLVHDKLNATPLKVSNPRGDTWETMGDGHLAGAPRSRELGGEAVQLSREAVEQTANTGTCENPTAALDVVPSSVVFEGAVLSIEQFAESPHIFESFLQPLLLDRTINNPLYQKIRSNIGLVADKADEEVTAGKRGVTEWGHRQLNRTSDFVHNTVVAGEELARRGVHKAQDLGHGALETGRRAVHAAEDLGHRGVEKAGELGHDAVDLGKRGVHRADELGHAAKDKAAHLGHGAVDLGRRGIRRAEDLGHRAKDRLGSWTDGWL